MNRIILEKGNNCNIEFISDNNLDIERIVDVFKEDELNRKLIMEDAVEGAASRVFLSQLKPNVFKFGVTQDNYIRGLAYLTVSESNKFASLKIVLSCSCRDYKDTFIETVKLVLKRAFEYLEVHSLRLEVLDKRDGFNVSEDLQDLGFRYSGVSIEKYFKDGEWFGSEYLTILEDTYWKVAIAE